MAASTPEGQTGQIPPIPQESHRAQIAVLTGLRGFAALMVLLIHSAGHTDHPGFGIQTYGPVSLFVLSGFLLYRPWSTWAIGQGTRPSVRKFTRRRLFRIFPAYLAVLFAVAVLYPASQPNGWDGWLRGITLTGIYASDGLRPGLEQTWSLGTELSWYLALPVMGLVVGLLARRTTPRAGFWLVTVALGLSLPVTAAWRWWVYVEDLAPRFTYPFWLPGFLVCFAVGASVAHLLNGERAGLVSLRWLRAVVARLWPVVLVLAAATAVTLSPLAGPDGYVPATFSERQVRFICATVLAGTLLVVAATGPVTSPINRVLGSRWLNAVGRWSYGVYLWHLPVIVLLADGFVWRSGVGGFLLWLGTILAISLPLGAASWAWVERPAIARSKATRRRRDPVPTAPTAPAATPPSAGPATPSPAMPVRGDADR
ncbi:MAG: acyltransferase family protein [Nocardioides sp.]